MSGDENAPRPDVMEEGLRAIEDVRRYADETVQRIALACGVSGEQISVRPPGVMDAAFTDLARMEDQARHFTAAMALVRQWMLPSDTRSLGNVMKVIPVDVADRITEHLQAAGIPA
jgi:hypothetical protein